MYNLRSDHDAANFAAQVKRRTVEPKVKMTEPKKTNNEAFSSFFVIACGLAGLTWMTSKCSELGDFGKYLVLGILVLVSYIFIHCFITGVAGARRMPVIRSKNPTIYWAIMAGYLVFIGFSLTQRDIIFDIFNTPKNQVDDSKIIITEQQKIFQNQLIKDAVYVGQRVSNVRNRSSDNWRYIVLSNDGKASITNVSPGTPLNKALRSPQYKGEYIIVDSNINIRGKDFVGETSLVGTVRKDSLTLKVDKHMGTVSDDSYFEYKRLQ
jgi:hypothetical protein